MTVKIGTQITATVLAADGSTKAEVLSCNSITARGVAKWESGLLMPILAIGTGTDGSELGLGQYVQHKAGQWRDLESSMIDDTGFDAVMYSTSQMEITFPTETAPVTYREYGLTDATEDGSVGPLNSFSLFYNAAGFPQAVNLQPGERLRVTYKIQQAWRLARQVPTLVDDQLVTATIVPIRLGKSAYVAPLFDLLGAAYVRAHAGPQALPEAGVTPSGGTGAPFGSSAAFDKISRRWTLSLPAGAWEFPEGIGMIHIGGSSYLSYNSFAVHFDPPIKKNGAAAIAIRAPLTNGFFYDGN